MTLIEGFKAWVRKIKNEFNALRIALTNAKTPWYAKTIIIITVAYALSPIDLIPDFIPILGFLDDLIILPLLISLAIKLIPSDVMVQSRLQASKTEFKKRKNWIAGGLILVLWAILIWWAITKFL